MSKVLEIVISDQLRRTINRSPIWILISSTTTEKHTLASLSSPGLSIECSTKIWLKYPRRDSARTSHCGRQLFLIREPSLSESQPFRLNLVVLQSSLRIPTLFHIFNDDLLASTPELIPLMTILHLIARSLTAFLITQTKTSIVTAVLPVYISTPILNTSLPRTPTVKLLLALPKPLF